MTKTFMLVWEGDPDQRGTFHSLADQRAANIEDEHYCEWLERAELGEMYLAGGGGAPACRTWRVS